MPHRAGRGEASGSVWRVRDATLREKEHTGLKYRIFLFATGSFRPRSRI